MPVDITRLTDTADLIWCAETMAGTDPWLTLKRDADACRALLQHPAKECYIVRETDRRVGVLVLDMNGTFAGYLQSVCLTADARGRGLGSEVIAWAEERIFRDAPNVFICVSSFNPNAQRLYERLGYSPVGTLTSYFVDEHDEILLRKSRGSWEAFRAARSVNPARR